MNLVRFTGAGHQAGGPKWAYIESPCGRVNHRHGQGPCSEDQHLPGCREFVPSYIVTVFGQRMHGMGLVLHVLAGFASTP